MLMHYIPEVKGIEEAPPSDDETDSTHKLQHHPDPVN